MGLEIYDSTQTLYVGRPFRAVVNGFTGGSYEEQVYLRNDDVTAWYTNITVSASGSVYDTNGELGTSGISFKFMYGERRPTEAEWSYVISGTAIVIPDIGDNTLADTSTYHPIWVRIYLPGNTAANIIDTFSINVGFLPRVVGS